MVQITEQFQILAAGDCAAIRTVLEDSGVAHRFRLESCLLRGDIMASIDLVAPDLILVDADGSDLAGLEACRALKDHPATMMLPIVVVSINSDLQMAAYSAGADDFVAPNSGDTVLLARLEALARAGSRRRKVAAASSCTRPSAATCPRSWPIASSTARGCATAFSLPPTSARTR
jgi:PleD family two-component response regulator